MNYAFTLVGDAQPDLRALEPWLEEETIDELEKRAADPSLLPPPNRENVIEFRFDRVAGATLHWVGVSLLRSDQWRTLIVLGIHRYTFTS